MNNKKEIKTKRRKVNEMLDFWQMKPILSWYASLWNNSKQFSKKIKLTFAADFTNLPNVEVAPVLLSERVYPFVSVLLLLLNVNSLCSRVLADDDGSVSSSSDAGLVRCRLNALSSICCCSNASHSCSIEASWTSSSSCERSLNRGNTAASFMLWVLLMVWDEGDKVGVVVVRAGDWAAEGAVPWVTPLCTDCASVLYEWLLLMFSNV